MKKLMIICFFLTLLVILGCEEKQDPSAKNTDETVVEGHGYVENIELFEQFYSNVKNNKKAEVNIFYIGKDGSNVEANVYYDTNNINITLSQGGSIFEAYSCERIYKNGKSNQVNYYVNDCHGDSIKGPGEIILLESNSP